MPGIKPLFIGRSFADLFGIPVRRRQFVRPSAPRREPPLGPTWLVESPSGDLCKVQAPTKSAARAKAKGKLGVLRPSKWGSDRRYRLPVGTTLQRIN